MRLRGALVGLLLTLAVSPTNASAALVTTLLDAIAIATDQTTYTSNAISPAANQIILVAVFSRAATTINTHTLSGCGMTWTEVRTQTAANLVRGTLFRGVSASPGSSCALTTGHGGQTQLDGWIIVHQWAGADIGGTNGSNAIVQSNGDNEASANVLVGDVTLAAFGDATNNGAVGFFYHGSSAVANLGAGFTVLGDQVSGGARRVTGEYKIGEDTLVDMDWASTAVTIGIAAEIKVAPAAASCAGRMALLGVGC